MTKIHVAHQEDIGNGNDPRAMTHLNFMKKQQWNVAYYAILLLAAVFAVNKAFEPSLVDWEKKAGTVLCISVLVIAMCFLAFIQYDIGKLRKRIGRDADPYSRGLEFTLPLGLTIIGACCTVVYGLWRDCPC
jgi:hypothetical protein